MNRYDINITAEREEVLQVALDKPFNSAHDMINGMSITFILRLTRTSVFYIIINKWIAQIEIYTYFLNQSLTSSQKGSYKTT